MADCLAQRKRADLAGRLEGRPSIDALSTIKSLPLPIVHQILQTAAQNHHDVWVQILEAALDIAKDERTKIVHFEHLSKSVWKALNVTYIKLKESDQYHAAGEATRTVIDCIKTIREGCSPIASYKTKANALETLGKIGETIYLSGYSVVGRETIKSFQSEPILEDTMLRIWKSMTKEEMKAVTEGEWFRKLGDLAELSWGRGLLKQLSEVENFFNKGEADNDNDEDGQEAGGSRDTGNGNVNGDGSEG